MINGVYKKEHGLSVKQWQDDVNKGVCVTWACWDVSLCSHVCTQWFMWLSCVCMCVYERLCLLLIYIISQWKCVKMLCWCSYSKITAKLNNTTQKRDYCTTLWGVFVVFMEIVDEGLNDETVIMIICHKLLCVC